MSMKIKYIVLCLLLALVGCQRDKEMEMAWVKVSNEVIEPRYESVRISSTISSNATVDNVTVILSTTPEFSSTTRYTMEKQPDGKYSVAIANLTHSTTYYVRYQGSNRWSSLQPTTISEFRTTDTPSIALVTTSQVTDISYYSASIGGNVTDDGGASVTERGICYSTSTNPTTANTKIISGSGLGQFTCKLTDLQDGTTYYVRAYAINAKSTSYGEEVSLTTLKAPFENGHEYVDLGLSVKWATMNVGASTPEDYGDYFAWGETSTKSTYNWSTYTLCKGSSSTLTKYNTSSSYGTVDNKTTLELSDDAARANWGGSWRMPTDAEMTELREQCTWTWTSQNGVNGCKVTSKSNGNSIFLPAAGYRNVSALSNAGSNGRYWSSSLNTVNPNDAWNVYFYSGSVYRYSLSRYYGLSVRPVCP
ncbi:MAG: DUF1566 domain-containing protein [Bacteroidales bacterium]|nr:DUF1566 domain-containing protein [Bacteroidales bacterium]